jgi:hypothetical protein
MLTGCGRRRRIERQQRVDPFDAAQPVPPSHWQDFKITEFVHSYF